LITSIKVSPVSVIVTTMPVSLEIIAQCLCK
jgi:hypothetical protein